MNSVNLKTARIKKGLTQKQLAESLSVDHRTVQAWEKGRNLPNVDMIIELSKLYDCDVAYLMGIQEFPKKEIGSAAQYTGLSYEAAEILHSESKNAAPFLPVLSKIIEDPDGLAALKEMAAFALSEMKDGYYIELGNGKREYMNGEVVKRARSNYIFDALIEALTKINKKYKDSKTQ